MMKNDVIPEVTGNTLRTVTGDYIDFADPQPDQFGLRDIAVGLGSECRFGNQLPDHYSVAEHSLHCLGIVSLWPGMSVSVKRSVLMHDAAEAFCGDIPKPLKILLPNYKVIEDRMQGVIDRKFGLHPHSQIVKRVDLMALKFEKSFFGTQDDQHDLSEIEDVSFDIRCLNRRNAAELFFDAALKLGIREVRS